LKKLKSDVIFLIYAKPEEVKRRREEDVTKRRRTDLKKLRKNFLWKIYIV